MRTKKFVSILTLLAMAATIVSSPIAIVAEDNITDYNESIVGSDDADNPLIISVDGAEITTSGTLGLTVSSGYVKITGGDGQGTIWRLDSSCKKSMITVSQGATLIMDNLTLYGQDKNMSAISASAPAINNSGTLIISNCSFMNCKYTGLLAHGAVITNAATGNVSLDNVTISDCSSTYYTGGIYNNGILKIKDSLFTDNTSRFGGTLYNNANSGSCVLNNTVIKNNSATKGGALFNNKGNVTFNDCQIYDNVAKSSTTDAECVGGGIHNGESASITLNNSVLYSNTAVTSGAQFNNSASASEFIINEGIVSGEFAGTYTGYNVEQGIVSGTIGDSVTTSSGLSAKINNGDILIANPNDEPKSYVDDILYIGVYSEGIWNFNASDVDVEPTATPTVEPTTTPTIEPTATPTVEPTATPTIEPTATPTVEPTATPTIEPTTAPAVTPTAVPTATPTIEPVATEAVEPTDTPKTEKSIEASIEFDENSDSLKFSILNNTDDVISAVGVAALYDNNGRLIKLRMLDNIPTSITEIIIDGISLTDFKAKLMIWNNLQTMLPYKNIGATYYETTST